MKRSYHKFSLIKPKPQTSFGTSKMFLCVEYITTANELLPKIVFNKTDTTKFLTTFGTCCTFSILPQYKYSNVGKTTMPNLEKCRKVIHF